MVTTDYALDQATGQTQVLADGIEIGLTHKNNFCKEAAFRPFCRSGATVRGEVLTMIAWPRSKVIFVFMVALLAASCMGAPHTGTAQTILAPATSTPSPATHTSMPLIPTQVTLPGVTDNPTPTLSPTLLPTGTPQAIPTQEVSTWTPLPTLTDKQSMQLVNDLLANNAGCQLPCWWGMVPGQTDWNMERHFLETFVIDVEQRWEETVVEDGVPVLQAGYDILYEIEDGAKTDIYMFVKNGIVEEAVIGGGGAQRSFRLHQLLTNYGPPDGIYIQAHRYTSDGGPPPFDFILYYTQKHFWAHFILEGKLVGKKLLGCPQSTNPRLWVGAPDREWELEDLFHYIFGPPVPGFPEYPTLLLKEATGMDLETFYNVFKDPDNQSCIETPADLWY